MTAGPHSVEAHESLSQARLLMRGLRIRHLPVMRKGRLVGLLSERDANLVEGLAYAPADAITVEDAMTREPYAVAPETGLENVVHAMIERRIGSAVVMEGSAVVGVFTTTDALRAFANLLEAGHDGSVSTEAIRARDVMTKSPLFATAEMPIREVARLMTEGRVDAIPIVDDPVTLRPVGIVTSRDIVCRALAAGKNPLLMTAAECMSSPCVVVDDAESIEAWRKVLAAHQIKHAPVVDSAGALCGMLAVADVARA